jgi:C4-dicarboxylate transporter
LAAQGFFAAQGFLAAQGFAAQGLTPFLVFLCACFLCCFMSQGLCAAQGLAFIAHGLPFMAQGFSAAYAEEAAIIATTPNITKKFFICASPLNVD